MGSKTLLTPSTYAVIGISKRRYKEHDRPTALCAGFGYIGASRICIRPVQGTRVRMNPEESLVTSVPTHSQSRLSGIFIQKFTDHRLGDCVNNRRVSSSHWPSCIVCWHCGSIGSRRNVRMMFRGQGRSRRIFSGSTIETAREQS